MAGLRLEPVPKDNVTDWGSTRPSLARYQRDGVAYWWTKHVRRLVMMPES